MSDLINFELHHPFTMCVIGPTNSGKTWTVVDLLRNRNKLLSIPVKDVLYIYCDFQPIFEKLSAEDPNIKFSSNLQDLETYDKSPALIVVDDQMDLLGKNRESNQIVTSYFVKHAHHRNQSIILILQNAFAQNLRVININSFYFLYFDIPRDRSTIRNIARQILPGQSDFLVAAYNRAVQNRDFGYVFLDLHPLSKKYKYWVRSCLFPSDECEVFGS